VIGNHPEWVLDGRPSVDSVSVIRRSIHGTHIERTRHNSGALDEDFCWQAPKAPKRIAC
jgi:hypothetical protein